MANANTNTNTNTNAHVAHDQRIEVGGAIGGGGAIGEDGRGARWLSQNQLQELAHSFAYLPPPPIEPVRTREHFLTVLGRHICPLSRYEEGWEQFIRDCPNDEILGSHLNVVYIESQRRPVVREIGRILGFFRGTWEREQDLRDVVEPIFMNYMAHYNISPEEADILEELADEFIPPEYRLGDNHWEWGDDAGDDGGDDGGDGNEPAEMAVREE